MLNKKEQCLFGFCWEIVWHVCWIWSIEDSIYLDFSEACLFETWKQNTYVFLKVQFFFSKLKIQWGEMLKIVPCFLYCFYFREWNWFKLFWTFCQIWLLLLSWLFRHLGKIRIEDMMKNVFDWNVWNILFG